MKLLKKIHIIGYTKENIDTIEGLKYAENLEEIRVSFINFKSYAGLENLKKLVILEVIESQLNDLQPISNLKNLRYLEYLHIYDNKVKDIEPLKNLVKLRGFKNQSPVMLVGNQITDGQKKLIRSKKIESICKIGGKGNEDSFSRIKKLIK